MSEDQSEHEEKHEHKSHKKHTEKSSISRFGTFFIVAFAILVIFNQWQISSITTSLSTGTGLVIKSSSSQTLALGGKDISGIQLEELKSTGHSIAALFNVESIQTSQDAVNVMIPSGATPYGSDIGISYDDPIASLSVLANLDRAIDSELSEEEFQRYLSIVTKPVGISCEFCCGVGSVGVNAQGKSTCGCQHNPALLALTKYLIKTTDYSDQEIIREAIKWKSLFFPKDMIKLALTVAGGDTSALAELPGMVGGC